MFWPTVPRGNGKVTFRGVSCGSGEEPPDGVADHVNIRFSASRVRLVRRLVQKNLIVYARILIRQVDASPARTTTEPNVYVT